MTERDTARNPLRLPDMERDVEALSASSVSESAVEVEISGSGPPQVVVWMNAIGGVFSSPLLVVEALHDVREVKAADIALDRQLVVECLSVDRLIQSQLIDAA